MQTVKDDQRAATPPKKGIKKRRSRGEERKYEVKIVNVRKGNNKQER